MALELVAAQREPSRSITSIDSPQIRAVDGQSGAIALLLKPFGNMALLAAMGKTVHRL
jgi:hypothetical protein